jgi:DNA replication protein DnaC
MGKRSGPRLPDTRHHDAGSPGVGKSWIACALGHKACRDDRSVLYHRVPRLLEMLTLARGDGRYGRMLKNLARVQLLILDDWGLAPLTAEQRRDLLEIMDDRHDRGSTIVTSQLPVTSWTILYNGRLDWCYPSR